MGTTETFKFQRPAIKWIVPYDRAYIMPHPKTGEWVPCVMVPKSTVDEHEAMLKTIKRAAAVLADVSDCIRAHAMEGEVQGFMRLRDRLVSDIKRIDPAHYGLISVRPSV